MSRFKRLITSLMILYAASAVAEFVPETAFEEILPDNNGQQWFWAYGSRIPSNNDGQAYLFDESGKRLGQLSTGFWFNSLANVKSRNEIVTVESYFSRGSRGERTDLVAIHDARTLRVKSEIAIPPKRMNGVKNNGLLRLTEDERFALIINYTPAQSISIVDLEKGVFVEEVETPGCSVIYGAGNRDFYSICGNGSFLQIKLDDDGKVVARKRSERLFDAVNDFVSIAASRISDTWYFVSRQYNVYAIKMAGDTIELVDTWSLVSDAEREDQWTIAAMDHTTTHAATNRLYVMMRQGEAHQFEEASNHVWVYDVATGEKLDEIELAEPAVAMKVSQGQEPKLYTMSFHFPIPILAQLWMFIFDGEDSLLEIARQRVSVYDGLTGEHRRDSELIPHGGFVLYTQPW